MEIEQQLAVAVKAAVKALYDLDLQDKQVQLSPTRKEFEGHLTLMVFPFMKQTPVKNPEQLGAAIGEWLTANEPVVAKYNVVKGFLNISINAGQWVEKLQDIYSRENYGLQPVTETSPLVMIEYSSPNTNKPLHLGHLRNILLGWSLSKIQAACGNKVVKTNIVNDRGIHICKSMLAWQKWFDGATPESAGKKGDHLIGDCYVAFDKHFKAEVKDILANDEEVKTIVVNGENGAIDEDKTAEARKAAAEAKSPLMQEARSMLRKWEAADPEVRALWAKMNEWVYAGFDETYKMMGVGFDKIYYESNTYLEGKDLVLEGLEQGKFFRKEDGSVWADFTNEGLDQKLLLRKDGTSVYMTQDIGTAKLRYQDFPIDKMIYVVGNEQNYHFQVLSLLLDRIGFKWGKDLVHFSYGMVELPNGRMKSREGTVVDADDLMASMIDDARTASSERLADMSDEEKENVYRQIGLGALKYFLLKVNPVNNMVFNPAESIDFNGNTGPFIQYTHARIKSLLRKAESLNSQLSTLNPSVEISEKENVYRQIGLGALKYFLLKVNPVNNMVFNPAESIDFNGNTGPFIQYTHARIKSLLRKAQQITNDELQITNASEEISEKEQTLIQKLLDFESVVLRAGKEYSPAQIANYTYDLAKEYNQFYHDTSILKEENVEKRELRLVLSACVARVIKTAMDLLGIEVPERM